MAIVKNMLVIFVCFLMLAACDLNEKTTFEVLFPVEETRNVDLEFRNERATLEFVLGDSLRKSVITIPVSGEQYARLWVGDMPYVIWLEAGKPWIAKFEGNQWYFAGKGADVNNYLNKRYVERIYFIDYYRIPNREFREKLDRVMGKREEALREDVLNPRFVEQERKRLRYVKNNHLASAVVYGEVKDGKLDLSEDTYAELQKAVIEDSASWKIPEYRESMDRVMLALAKMKKLEGSFYDISLEVLHGTISTFKDERLIEYIVNKNVMAYMKALSVGTTGEMDSIFRNWVHQPILVEAYDNLCRANRKLEKGQPAVSFTFPDINGKEVSLSDFKGKYVYVDLWATWCGPCNAEIPSLKKLEEEFQGRNIYFVSISCDKSQDEWEKFVKERQMGGIQLHMRGNNKYMEELGNNGVPRFLLIDREGNFIDANMLRPSDPKTLKILRELEGI